jgi:hypothetical protein
MAQVSNKSCPNNYGFKEMLKIKHVGVNNQVHGTTKEFYNR